MEKEKPIGVFDLGLGGLTVVKKLTSVLPKESIVFFGNNAGDINDLVTSDLLVERCIESIDILKKKNVKAVIAAGNTVSAIAAASLRPLLPVPLIELVMPGASAAAKMTSNGRIGIIAASAVINSGAYNRQLMEINHKLEIFTAISPALTGWAAGQVNESEALQLLNDSLQPIKNMNVDTLILASNYYTPFIGFITEYFGGRIQLVETGAAAAESARAQLERVGMVSNSNAMGRIDLYFSDVEPLKADRIATLLGKKPGALSKI